MPPSAETLTGIHSSGAADDGTSREVVVHDRGMTLDEARELERLRAYARSVKMCYTCYKGLLQPKGYDADP